MKRVFLSFLIIGILRVPGFCDCAYFRTSAALLKCAVADVKTLKANDPYPTPVDGLELEEPSTQTFVHVECNCEYSLMGSDPRCDMEQSSERSNVIGVESPSNPCRRAAAMCRDVCPGRLP